MKDSDSIEIRKFRLRARLPLYFRVAAAFLIAIVLIGVGIGYFRARSVAEFRMVGFPTELSKDVVASVSGFERRENDGDLAKYYIRADKATTYSDNHQELENVYLQVFDADGTSNEISSQKAVYVPAANKEFSAFFSGDVKILTRDGLRLKTEQLRYDRGENIAVADELIRFERENLTGSALGGTLDLKQRSIELNRDVELEISDAQNGSHRINAGRGVFLQDENRIAFTGRFHLISNRQAVGEQPKEQYEFSADRAFLRLEAVGTLSSTLLGIELFDDVRAIRSRAEDTVTILCRSARYERAGDVFQLADDVTVVHEGSGSTRKLSGDRIQFAMAEGRLEVSGNGNVEVRSDQIRGNSITADLRTNGMFKSLEVSGTAFLRRETQNEITEIRAEKIVAGFDLSGNAASAKAGGRPEIVSISNAGGGSSSLRISAGSVINAIFHENGGFQKVASDGRTAITLETIQNGSDSSNKTIIADSIESTFGSDGRTFTRAVAIGNAEFVLTPHRSGERNFKTRIDSPRIECDFYSGSNTPSSCVSGSRAKLTRTPTISRDGRGDQVITSTTLTARFGPETGNIIQMDAVGKARFTELDRQASARTFVFTTVDEIARLRGEEPTAWDSRARVKAKEIDWDTRNARSAYRGSVSTTYYSSKLLGSLSPFGESGKPVYVTSEICEMDHANEIAEYSGNVRLWQGASYVRAGVVVLKQNDSTLEAKGNVQSGLFRSTLDNGKAVSPIFASAESMQYSGDGNWVRYDRNVTMRKGSDQISGNSARISLNDVNEMTAAEFESGVTILQPRRKAFSDFALYTVADDKLVIRGRPARIEDAERGTLVGAELTIHFADKRILGIGPSRENPAGRVRSTYKVQ